MILLYIAFGSAAGGVLRYLLGGAIQRAAGGTFPLGTLLINITGSFLLGLLYRYSADSAAITPEVRAMLTIGLCGGYTTFSSFSYESIRLLEDGQVGRALLYVGLSVVLCLAATALGIMSGRELVALRRG
ncbi:MAG TPA: fluoride efflux transporter CrcB [Gemmatimonadales bacterium]|nr:fluoride efflux transporter CrcB [Gemmatimonadales bacterium]